MSAEPEKAWALVVLRNGQPSEVVTLSEEVMVIGRDSACGIRLTDQSISRRHAEVSVKGGILRVRDLGSRNGVRVNGVPRVEAVLQHGDTFEVGSAAFQVTAGASAALPKARLAAPSLEETDYQEPTRRQRLALPKLGNERSLSTLYHVCAWLAEDLEETAFTEKCLQILQEGLESMEVHLYGSQGALVQRVGERDRKPAIKLAPFLVSRFQSFTETTIARGAEIRRHQAAAGKFNFLIGPLRPSHAEGDAFPFVVLVRPVEWRDFTTDDRVLLQSVCQLWVRALKRVRDVAALRSENAVLRRRPGCPQLLGDSAALAAVREQALRAARTRITVTLLGETGSGKEVLAHFIHQHSPRGAGPFIKVNCAAIPEGLIESELFGHVQGAFTDARADHRGKFEQAHGGTLFLDEVGETPAPVQAKLLRAIETGEIEKLGCEKPLQVDVRIVAASHRDLQQLVRERQFREDLFYRLSVLAIRMPPLREHPEDIGAIAGHFLGQFCAENGLVEMEFAPDAVQALQRHGWPGNVRELRNVVQRCAVHSDTARITGDLVREQLRHAGACLS